MDIEKLIEYCGFDCVGSCAAQELVVRPEVRDMCASGRCQKYGHSWACPPACGELEDFKKLISSRTTCYVFQSVGKLEDEFDVEVMLGTEKLQKERLYALADKLVESGIDADILSAGTCTICKECTYPDAPCRFPEKRFVSMEAAGLVVTEACESAGIPYNHGPLTIAYSSAVLV